MGVSDHLIAGVSRLVRRVPPHRTNEQAWVSIARAATLASVNRLVTAAVPFAGRARFRVVALSPGYLKAEIPLRGNRNHLGTLYAGAQFTLAEIPGGVLSLFTFDPGTVPVLKSLEMQYLKPAKTDVTVEFRLEEVEVANLKHRLDQFGKAEFTLCGQLQDESGEIVAKSIGLYQLRRRNTPAQGHSPDRKDSQQTNE